MIVRNDREPELRRDGPELDERARMALIRKAAELEASGQRRAAADLLAMLNAASRRARAQDFELN